MERYKFEDFIVSDDIWTSVEDGEFGEKIEIDISSPLVPVYYREKMSGLLNDFIKKHGIGKPVESIESVSGLISAYINENVQMDKKYFLSLYVYVRENGDIKDYIVNFPVLPSEEHFSEFKKCVMREFENMVFGKYEEKAAV